LHKYWSIKTEILVFLGSFYLFFNMLLWPDPGRFFHSQLSRRFHSLSNRWLAHRST
jgi:hypothetical protein